MEKDNTQDDIAFLVNEVKQLRRERADLMRRLTQLQDESNKTQDAQFSVTELGRLTGGIVHDMRNGLEVIGISADRLHEALIDTPYAKDALKISRGADFCEVVLDNLSALGGRDKVELKKVNLETIAREMFFLLENKLVDVKLVIPPDKDEPVIMADEGHMKQLFMNLIKNAGEAMHNGGTLTCRFHKQADMMCIEIQDTGDGIPEEHQQQLFRKFYTTKQRGYGLGLFIVHSIVKWHRGEISVKSKKGEGTTFTILLPSEDKRDDES